jgi:hypothetical protein
LRTVLSIGRSHENYKHLILRLLSESDLHDDYERGLLAPIKMEISPSSITGKNRRSQQTLGALRAAKTPLPRKRPYRPKPRQRKPVATSPLITEARARRAKHAWADLAEFRHEHLDDLRGFWI